MLLYNSGFSLLHELSKSCGSLGFGNRFRYRDPKTGKLTGDFLEIDYLKNAKSLGAHGVEAKTRDQFKNALSEAKDSTRTTVIVVELEPSRGPSYDSWWDVPVADVSEMPTVQKARENYEQNVKKERYHL